jgi:signal transduction histidine kinase
MPEALGLLQLGVGASFVLLFLVTLADWLRQHGRSRAYLAAAIGFLAATALAGQANELTNHRYDAVLTDLTLLAFMASAYALLLFRGTFLPLSRRAHWLAGVGCLGAAVLAAVAGLQSNVRSGYTGLQYAAILAVVIVWTSCVGEPIVRFWLASRRRPAVQRARLRALAAAYAAIIVILVISGLGGTAAATPAVQVVLQLIGLASVPLLYVSFAPPAWLRRAWREREEEEFSRAIQDLLLFSPDRATLASRGLDWAMRLVGAGGGAVVESGGEILALRDLEAGQARLLAQGGPRQDALVMPLHLDTGQGALVVVSGPFTPLFGEDEVARLRQYAISITVALDRTRVVERMAAVESMKSQFLNLASHELRSPLSVIGGYVAMLEQGSLGELQEGARWAVKVLRTKTREMNVLVEQMLDAARLEDGSLALKLDLVDLTQLVNESVDAVRPMATDRHRLVVQAPAGELLVMADHSRLGSILVNLLDNAIKYSPEGGEVCCQLVSEDAIVKVLVQDHGVGIADADMHRLFTRFGRITTPDTQHIGGTGLGLYLSRQLAQQHGGDLTVQSQPGAGSTFTLRLPRAPAGIQRDTGPRLRLVKSEEEAGANSQAG